MNDVPHILGHSEHEIQRLILQAEFLKPITLRLLRDAGLAAGMRVLDLGCGSGDVTMLAAELVGGSGSVVGIDRNAKALAVARDRARAGGYSNIAFREVDVEDFVDPTPFDFAIGRYVLIHQVDPAGFIHAAASQVRPGGVVAFHEAAIYDEYLALAPVPLWQQTVNSITAAFKSVMAHPDAAGRMTAHFHAAGLKQPVIFCEALIGGGPDSPLYMWATLTLRSLLPQLVKVDAVTAAQADIETLEDRLREAVTSVHGQAFSPPQFCGWARV